MKICIVTDGSFSSTYGGGQVYCRNIVDEFIRIKNDNNIIVSIISSEPGDNTEGRELFTDGFYNGIHLYKGISADEIKQILTIDKPDIVHANGNYNTVIHVCKELNIKSIITIHDSRWMCPNITYLNTKEKLCSEKTSIRQCLLCELSQIRFGKIAYPIVRLIPIDRYVAIGESMEKRKFYWYISPVLEAAIKIKRKIDIWNDIKQNADVVIEISHRMAKMGLINGLESRKMKMVLNGTPRVSNTDFPLPSKKIRFYYTGRICYSKGIHILLKAFNEIKNDNIELHLWGDGDIYKSKLEYKFRKDRRIVWHNKISHKDILLHTKDMHVFIHPSIANEACSLSILEALSAGKFVIATKCGGPEDLIIEDVNGWLVPPNDKEQLKDKIIKYFSNPSAPKEIIYNDITKHVSDLISIYSQVI